MVDILALKITEMINQFKKIVANQFFSIHYSINWQIMAAPSWMCEYVQNTSIDI